MSKAGIPNSRNLMIGFHHHFFSTLSAASPIMSPMTSSGKAIFGPSVTTLEQVGLLTFLSESLLHITYDRS